MARGIRRFFKAVSNPVGTLVNMLTKSKKKAKVSAPRRGKSVNRKYKRVKARGDGQGNQIISVAHGRQHRKLNKNLEVKIRDALNPMDTYIIQGTEQNNSLLLGQCTWSVWELGSCDDIDKLLDKAGIARGNGGKLKIANSSMELEITNQSTNVLNLKIYEYVARRDLPSEIGSTAFSTELAVTSGFGNRPVGKGQADQHTLGATLFDNPFFTAYNRIVRVKNYVLGSGRTLKMNMTNNKDKWINPMTYFDIDTETETNYTRGFVFQCYGSMVGAPAPSDDGQTTTGNVGYDVFFRRKYHFNQPTPASGAVYLTDNVPKTIAGGLPYAMNPSTQSGQYQNTA